MRHCTIVQMISTCTLNVEFWTLNFCSNELILLVSPLPLERDGRGCFSPYNYPCNYIVNKRIILKKKMGVKRDCSFWASVKFDVWLSESKLSKAIINLNILFQRTPAFTLLENKALMRHCTIVQMISTYTLNVEFWTLNFCSNELILYAR